MQMSRAHSRGDVVAEAKPTKPESQRRSAKVSVPRQSGHPSARTLMDSDDVALHRAEKEVAAFARSLGVRVPRQWLDLAAGVLE
jgi:hypothetical protein